MLAKQRCFTGCFTAVGATNKLADVVEYGMCFQCLDADIPSLGRLGIRF
mgnify:CR=1 FL=1